MIPKSQLNLFMALAFFFLSLLAYVYATQQYEIGLLQYQLLKFQSPTPTPTVVTKTYRNEKFGFEFKYDPALLTLFETNMEDEDSWSLTTNRESGLYLQGGTGTLNDWLKNYFSKMKNDPNRSVLGQTPIQIRFGENNFNYFSEFSFPETEGSEEYGRYVFESEKKLFFFGGPLLKELINNQGEHLLVNSSFYQVLSSFKLID